MRSMQYRWTRLSATRFFGSDGDDDPDTDPQEGAKSGEGGDGDKGDGKPVEDKYSQAYVDKLRKEAAKYRVSGKESVDELSKVKAELAKIKQAEMSDLEKANTMLEESSTELETEKATRLAAESALRTERIQNAVMMAAVDAGFEDPSDALSMISQDDLVDDEGTILTKAVKASLKALADKKPYLLKKSHPGSGDGSGFNKLDKPDSFEAKEKGYLKTFIEDGSRIVVGG